MGRLERVNSSGLKIHAIATYAHSSIHTKKKFLCASEITIYPGAGASIAAGGMPMCMQANKLLVRVPAQS